MTKSLLKSAICLIFTHFLSNTLLAQEIIPDDKREAGKFCSVLKNGSMKLEKDGIVSTKEITLRDGSKITKEGTVVRKDGSNVLLKNGECIDMDGNIENIPLEKMEEKNNLTDANEKKKE